MKDIKKTLFMKEAASKKGHNIIVEICIAVLLFFIGSIAMGFIQIPAMMAYLFSNKDYMSMIISGRLDRQKMLSVLSDMPEWIMIVMLFAEILLTLIVMLYCKVFERRKLSTLGFVKKGMVKQYIGGLVAGAAAFSAVYIICVITGSVKCEGISQNIMPLYIIGYFLGYLLQGMAEEVLCRGYLMVSLSRRYHVTLAIAASSLFFAFLHSGNSGLSPIAYINLFLFGVFASLLLLDFGNIWIAGAFHSIWNFAQGNIYGVQVSGMNVSNSILSTSYTDGMEIINGGSFGMEGGLAVSFIFIAGIALLSYHLYKKGNIIDLQEFQGTQYNYEHNMGDNNTINTGNMAGIDDTGSTESNSSVYGTGNPVDINGAGDNIYGNGSYAAEDGSIIINKEANVVDSDVIKNNTNINNTGQETGKNVDSNVQKTTFNQDYFKD
ncbi:MAG: CPBP family intramembrane metalloprotease [Lachnospiraceae bacterium]|nr:CPBP family intramembrane metalloprotease [Lachnospiraceae bacterium]